MKTPNLPQAARAVQSFNATWHGAMVNLIALACSLTVANGQGVLTFDNTTHGTSTDYCEGGMRLHVTPAPPNAYSASEMWWTGGGNYGKVPENGTAYMRFRWYNALNKDYVVLTPEAGGTFGMVSIDLADYAAPYLTNLTVGFKGVKSDGSSVATSFTSTGADTKTFQTFYFDSGFSSDLTSLEMTGPGWSMDNLVFVPEPGTWFLLGGGLLAWAWLAKRRSGV